MAGRILSTGFDIPTRVLGADSSLNASQHVLGRTDTLGAAGEALGYDKHLKVNTAKKRTHSLFTQGAYYFMAMPRMSDARLSPLVDRFGQLVREYAVFREAFGLI
ncbi:hypothetical protein [Myxococcus xanthus]|uniref:Uncharacterized protein n=1 Tax=Myxococcus xanthus TaxID=34 RepID=A0AAE6FW05_MYXXA|nr:hypothetical protein [Myxococcus xanthus]QDE66326.1 hypothetical protein BHS09_04555 [Myxococcus xanthus]QDE73599.1 hypothetical protein BHS08_04560 [Myxococcus xanthus]QDE95194.1 hypothetical protein BHS05_04580 [Myxococcus xanthus]